jgi:hypothetical protein
MVSTELSVTHLRVRKAQRRAIQLPRFQVFDGAVRIVIEAQSEEDARYLCSEMGWELICACEG